MSNFLYASAWHCFCGIQPCKQVLIWNTLNQWQLTPKVRKILFRCFIVLKDFKTEKKDPPILRSTDRPGKKDVAINLDVVAETGTL